MATVLLIEDDADLLANTAKILSLSNYQVIAAENGRVALERIQGNAKRIDIVLCDVAMPELDGYGFFHAYKNKFDLEATPFIFMTANSERHNMRRCMDLGADDYLIKPFTSNEILSLIATRLKKSYMRRERTSDHTQRLASVLFEQADFAKCELFRDHFQVRNIRRKETLYCQGEISSCLYYLISGRMKRFTTTNFGKEYTTNIHNPGDFFGNLSINTGGRYQDYATALEDSEVAVIAKTEFLKVLLDNSEICLRYLNYMHEQLIRAEEKLPKLAYNSARKRVADAILYVAGNRDGKLSENYSFSISRDDLSAISGIAPESVSRNLSSFKSEGLIDTHNGKIIIKDFRRLEKVKN